ncbi:MAG: hypothetical protein ACI85O_002825, partial [Saprospiraceae bacterium]
MTKIKISYLFLLLFLGYSSLGIGQEKALGKVFVGNTEEGNSIMIKWIVPEILHKEGCNIYRKEKGEWKRINDKPVMKTTLNIPANDRDETIAYLEDFVENKDVANADGITKVLLSKQFVLSNDFAEYLGVFFEDTQVLKGENYEYKITQIQADKERLIGYSPMISALPFEPIAAPKFFKLVPDEKVDTLIRISWLPEEDRYFGIEVYRAEIGGELKKINKNIAIPSRTKGQDGKYFYPDFFYSNANHILGSTYQYQIRALDFFGRETRPTESLEWTALDRSPAPVPTEVQVIRFKETQVLLTWADTTKALNIKGFNVWMGRTVDGQFTQVNSEIISPNTFQYFIDIKGVGDYFFYVEALNLIDQASASFTTGLSIEDITPPKQPQNLLAFPRSGFIDLKWKENTEADFAGYIVFRSSTNDGKPFLRISGVPFLENNYTNKLPKASKNTFFYKIAAVDTATNMSITSEIAQTAMPDVIAPVAPTIIKINMDSIDATITWLPSIDDDLKGYTIYKCINDDTLNWTAVNQIPLVENTRNYTDKNLPPNTKVSYKLIAEDNTGNRSVFSNTYTSMTPVVSSQNTTINKLKVNYDKRKNQMVIKWKPIDLKEVRSITLFRKSNKGHFLPISSELKTEKGFIDKTLNPGQTYSY